MEKECVGMGRIFADGDSGKFKAVETLLKVVYWSRTFGYRIRYTNNQICCMMRSVHDDSKIIIYFYKNMTDKEFCLCEFTFQKYANPFNFEMISELTKIFDKEYRSDLSQMIGS